MTLPEKIGQMVQIEQSQVTDTTSACTSQGGFNLPNPTCEQKILVDDHVGSILAGGSDIPIDTTGKGGPGNTGLDWATEYNTMQSYAIAHSRLHIPVIFGVDAVHGFGHPYQAPLFPQSIGMGATWDPSAAEAGGAVTANALRATGWNWDFAPVQDIARDNRWGRYYETWSEEPTLAAAMGAANVRGLQSGGAGGLKVTATVKHFAGYSGSINGHDRVQAERAHPLTAGFVPAVVRGRDQRERGHGHGGLRLGQRDSRYRVALPADHAAARPDGLQGRGDQRLR